MHSNKRRKNQRPQAQKPRRLRAVAFAGIVIAVIAVAVVLLMPAIAPQKADARPGVIDINADMAGFSLPVVTVKVGQAVTVRLRSLDNDMHSDGGGKHQWAVDELKVSIVAPPKGFAEATFTPSQQGEYQFYCDICCGGRANPTMQGKLVVEA